MIRKEFTFQKESVKKKLAELRDFFFFLFLNFLYSVFPVGKKKKRYWVFFLDGRSSKRI